VPSVVKISFVSSRVWLVRSVAEPGLASRTLIAGAAAAKIMTLGARSVFRQDSGLFRRDPVVKLRHAIPALILGAGLGAIGLRAQSSSTSQPPAGTTNSQAPASTSQSSQPVPLKQEGKIDLIRGLSSEVAVAKITLPRGKHGILIDAQGKVDQSKAQQETKDNGAAVNAGTPVKITKVDFKGDRVTFEINGGGKNGKHWYQHLEIGMGTTTTPIAPQQQNQSLSYGSYITLRFQGHVPNLTTDQAKKLLAPALDFERHSPTVLYSEAIPPKFKEAIKNHQVLVGMDHDAVLSAKGAPDRKVREDQPDGSEKENWIYGLPPHVLYITFDGDTVVSVKQY
jgi:hypothetical protein